MILAISVLITKISTLNSNNVLILNNVISVIKLIHTKQGVFRTAKLSLCNSVYYTEMDLPLDLLLCSILNANRRTKNRRGLGMRLYSTTPGTTTVPSRGFSKAFLSSESCRISDSVALSSGFLLSIQRSSLFVNSYS